MFINILIAFSKLSFLSYPRTMSPLETNVEPYREEIINLLQRRHTYNSVCDTLNT